MVDRLRDAGYRPQVQPFFIDVFRENAPAALEQVAPTPTTYADGEDFGVLEYSGSGDVTGEVVAVDTDLSPSDTSTSGCGPADFAAFPAEGAIVLMQRGTCTFATKVANATNAGAIGAIAVNRGTPGNDGVLNGTLGGPGNYVPAVGASYATGVDLADVGTVARISVDAVSENARTWNVTAETSGGNGGNVVMAGAHLDSVAEGAGINDNGTGSAGLLEMAEAAAERGSPPGPRPPVRRVPTLGAPGMVVLRAPVALVPGRRDTLTPQQTTGSVMTALLLGSISTLADTSEIQREAFNRAFAQHGLDWQWGQEEYAGLLRGNGGKDRVAEYARGRGEDVDAEAVHATKSELFQAALAETEIAPRDGVVETIRQAQEAGTKVALVTTTSRANLDALGRAIAAHLDLSSLDLVVDASQVETAKPDPAAYRYALEQLGEEPGACVAIEDNVGGVQAANAAGVASVAFPNENTAGHDFSAASGRVEQLALADLQNYLAAA